ncbi:acyl-CoA-binding domain-containing protein 5 isoform X1 [Cygnus olor]|uniref:acyl-CoA-binding domain-containing protein 5 isoform X1 n=1 Tax=Cygnus atratus TaxID=8868 RepID=UPI0015D65C77|nr:acyl-CoA-binding domain-containing protein 5 isoform X1 [Cygnus atratus]XP_040403272.1 acyl-CoA-binding domain-containing protein 5 isoform X1 [Cygnus olor]XP_040403274.1 acyl-CoA-binding domain-containing protein 5 isoform X1 [Cygnus olor]XP_050564780.1 acyl-CoA-binding domain-containing protein 5 isoform X1 [Cygnus atratus]
MAETGSVHATRFEAAVKVIQSLPKNGSFQPTNEMMLKFYSFYKQATQGPCNIPRPGFWDPIGRYKWDAWSALGDMSKEEAMIAYVEEMKKILESMPMTEKVEELLQVIGPFYEIVEDKKNRGSDLTSVRMEKVSKYLEDLSNVMNSTPNIKAVNGKAESSDSGAESEEEGLREEEEKELQQNVKDYKSVKTESAAAKDLESIVANGCYKDGFIPDLQNGIQTKSALNGLNTEEEIKKTEPSLEIANNNAHQGGNEENTEEVSGTQHLTSDSDSEVYCDSMEQLGLEEPLEIITSTKGSLKRSSHFLDVDHSVLLENTDLPRHVCMTSGNLQLGNNVEGAVQEEGEVKCGGEDGQATNGGPHKEKKSGEKADFYGVRRGRGHRLQPLGDGSQGGQMGSGGDGERWGSDRGPRGSLNEQIAVVLMRLQEDMQNVLQRLHMLEAVTASQARSATLQSNYQPDSSAKKPSWWPFEISPGILAFAVVWPFIAQWLVHVYLQRKRRKQN